MKRTFKNCNKKRTEKCSIDCPFIGTPHNGEELVSAIACAVRHSKPKPIGEDLAYARARAAGLEGF